MHTHSEFLPPLYLEEIVKDVIRKKAVGWTVPDCGLSAAFRYSVELDDGSRVFVKAATDEETTDWLRREHFVLSTVRLGFMPYIVDWIDKPGAHPILISQDLSHAYWPASHKGVSWREGDFELLRGALKELSAVPAPAGLPELHGRSASGWSWIAANPEVFLGLGLCSERWLGKSIGALVEAEMGLDMTGSCLVHGDVRSDNICLLDSKVVFVDWSHASRGYGRHDLATLLPTFHLEGGPAPYEVMPDGGGEAAVACAAHVYRLAADGGMPEWLKAVFRRLIAIELEWAAKCLGLSGLDGVLRR
jgi:hypothetical protein